MKMIDAETGMPQLAMLLTEALALADTLELPIAAIHIDEALAQIADLAPFPTDRIPVTERLVATIV